MKKNNKIKLLISLLILITVSSFFLINSIIGKEDKFTNFKSLFNKQQKKIIKRYIFPYKFISEQEQILSRQQKATNRILSELELKIKDIGSDIGTTKSSIKLSNNKNLNKYYLNSGFYYGIYNMTPGSGFIDFYDDNIFILSSRGILAFTKSLDDEEVKFKQIKNNINDFIDLKQFEKKRWFSLKDILIYKNQVFISFTEEIEKDCWNTSIVYGNINFENIQFKKLFSFEKCVHSKNNIDKEFNAHQSGGKVIAFDDNHILLSIGDYRSRHLTQNKESVNGKIIKININNDNYEIISMGHRNAQGLYFDKENNFILETEHGPMGGDEINLIEVNQIDKLKTLNYGWPIASYGEHYGGKTDYNKKRYEKYPLYKSHSEYGFIEPLKSFVPSIGISKIVKIKKNKYVLCSLKDHSLYFFELDKAKKIINLDRVEVFERVRDLRFHNNKLYLFLEDTASIGVIDLYE